jgi:hypothetical protein
MNKKTVSIPLPKIEGVELKSATVDLEKGAVVAEYGQEEWQEDREKDISEIAVNFGSAVDYLLEDNHLPHFLTTKKHMPKLDALNQLIILAEAWNSFDEFKPDWEDTNQCKHYPLFNFINGEFEFSHVGSGRWVLDAHISNFSFKTEERAEQFGKQFIELFRIVLAN